MKCYRCGNRLEEGKDTCGRCGADVRLYRKIMRTSNAYYNRGLEKAKVRDLTGAAACLRTSLDLNKRNIKARNLLGLVYYEMGEAVPALREWIISKNMKMRHNIAGAYIKDLQENRLDLDSMDQTIRKYNMALKYVQEGSEDLALIQLKRVVMVNPRLVKAYQLLALLHMKNGRYGEAGEVLKRCLAIDRGNTTTLRYLKEVRDQGAARGKPKKRALGPEPVPVRREELDGQPMVVIRRHDIASYLKTAVYVTAGVLMGALLTALVAAPGIRRAEQTGYQEQLKAYEEKLSSRDQNVASLERQIQELQDEKEELQDGLDAYTEDGTGILDAYGVMLDVLNAYRLGDLPRVVELYQNLNGEATDNEKYQEIYQEIRSDYEGGLFDRLMQEAAAAREAETPDVQKALDDYEAALVIRPETPEAIFWAGNMYHRLGQLEQAREYYTRVAEEYGDTEWAAQAQAQMALIP